VPVHHGDGSALPMIVKSGYLGLEIWSSGECRVIAGSLISLGAKGESRFDAASHAVIGSQRDLRKLSRAPFMSYLQEQAQPAAPRPCLCWNTFFNSIAPCDQSWLPGFARQSGLTMTAAGSYPKPAKQLAEFFFGPALWFWGHEHRMAINEEFGIDGGIRAFGRCVGHGGMPVDLPPAEPMHSECRVEFR
jgi:hypothetical protein